MLDFPSSPTVGQVFGTWAWDGTKWSQGNAPVPPAVVSSFNTRTGAVTFQQADATAVGVLRDVGRNFIHNPQFTVQQRGLGPWTANGAYTADRWVQWSGGDTINTVINAMDDTIRAQIGDETANSTLYTTFTGSAAAGGLVIIQQNIENVRRLAGKTVTLSFVAATNGAALRIGVSIDQIFGTGGSPSAFVSVAAQTITATATWTRYSLTFALPSIAGKTLGTNNNDTTNLLFWYSSGSTYAVRAGNPGVQSGGIALWGVQLEIGSTMTPLDYGGSYGDQLRFCQRYYQTTTATVRMIATGPTQSMNTPMYWQPMRVSPTATLGAAGGRANISNVSVIVFGNNSGRIDCSSTAAGDAYILGDIWNLSADL